MSKLTMFYLENCPYCRAARNWVDELKAENNDYADIDIEMIEESEQPDLADSYDYYFVPTYYIGRRKLHEGAATREAIEAVLKEALIEE